MRAALAKLDANNTELILTLHHLVCDARSTELLVEEMIAIYNSAKERSTLTLTTPKCSYSDFAARQHQWQRSAACELQEMFWRQTLQPPVYALELPTDRPRPAIPRFEGGSYRFSLSKRLTQLLGGLCKRYASTRSMVLLAAYLTLLHHHTQQNDLVIGIPTSGRKHPETEGMVGCFVSVLPLRIDVSDNPSFGTLIGRVRRGCIDIYINGDVCFERIASKLHLQRDFACTPLIRLLFSYEGKRWAPSMKRGLSVDVAAVPNGTAKFDLTLFVAEYGEHLNCLFEFDIDLFERITIRRLAERFLALLDDMFREPDRRLSDARIMTEFDLQEILAWSRGTARV
jgi:hypothetical protein